MALTEIDQFENIKEDGSYRKFPCPCGGEIKIAQKTRTQSNGDIIRTRKCLECGALVTTREIQISPIRIKK